MTVPAGQHTLNAALRQRIRQARDQQARDRLSHEDQIFRTGKCAGCGMSYDDRTPGCSVCTDRHRSRRRHKPSSELRALWRDNAKRRKNEKAAA